MADSRRSPPRLTPALALSEIGLTRLHPARPRIANLSFPEHGFGFEAIHQIIGRLERSPAVDRGCASEDDRLARGDGPAAVDDADMADVEALGACDGNLFQRLASERWMMLQYQRVDRIAVLRLRPRQAHKAYDGAIAARLLHQLGKLELRVECLGFEEGDDTHPPHTGGSSSITAVCGSGASSPIKLFAATARLRRR